MKRFSRYNASRQIAYLGFRCCQESIMILTVVLPSPLDNHLRILAISRMYKYIYFWSLLSLNQYQHYSKRLWKSRLIFFNSWLKASVLNHLHLFFLTMWLYGYIRNFKNHCVSSCSAQYITLLTILNKTWTTNFITNYPLILLTSLYIYISSDNKFYF